MPGTGVGLVAAGVVAVGGAHPNTKVSQPSYDRADERAAAHAHLLASDPAMVDVAALLRADGWHPYRSYAAGHLWHSLAR